MKQRATGRWVWLDAVEIGAMDASEIEQALDVAARGMRNNPLTVAAFGGFQRADGWDERRIYEATALISLFNFSGRLEAPSGLPMDQIPEGAQFPEATPGKPSVSARA